MVRYKCGNAIAVGGGITVGSIVVVGVTAIRTYARYL